MGSCPIYKAHAVEMSIVTDMWRWI